MNELLPCPFCGCNRVTVDLDDEYYSSYYVSCYQCDAIGGSGAIDDGKSICDVPPDVYEKAYDKAIQLWNMRVSDWNDAKKCIPPKEGAYLVYIKCTDGGATTILYYTQKELFYGFNVTHWMPLPESPKFDKLESSQVIK